MASAFAGFRNSYNFLQRSAHESPVYFYSCLLGAAGPVFLLVVPPVRRRLGYVRPEAPPKTFPLPNRPRRPMQGYDDEDS